MHVLPLLTALALVTAPAGPDPNSAIVDVRAFGAVGDGSTDDSAAFEALHRYLQEHDGTTVLIPSGTYSYRSNRWLVGVRNVRVIGSGARLRCTSPMAPWDSDPIGLVTGGDPFHEGAGFQPAHRFASARAGDRTVRLLRPTDAHSYRPGDWVLVFGYAIYAGGWPPSTRYHEFRQVQSVDPAGSVTFVRPIRNEYDDRWYDVPGAYAVGAPRLLRLSRREDFTLGEDIYIEGVEFVKGPHEPTYFSKYDRGGLYAAAALSITLVRCKIGYLDPTVVAQFRAVDSDIDRVEVDKLIDSAIFERCRIGITEGGTGCDSLILRDSDLLDSVSILTQTVLLDNCNLYASDPQNHFAHVTATGGSVALRNNKLWRRPGDKVSMFHGGGEPLPLRVVSAGAGAIRVNLDRRTLEPFLTLRIGTRLRTRTTPMNEGTASAIYWDGQHVVVEADFRFQPSANDVFYVSPTRQLWAEGNLDVASSDRDAFEQTAGAARPESYRNDADAGTGNAGQVVVPFPRDLLPHPVAVPGCLTAIEVVVLDAVAQTSIQIFASPHEAGLQLGFDTSHAGLRRCDSLGCQGLREGDAGVRLPEPSTLYDQVYVYAKAARKDLLPRGLVALHYLRP